MIYAIINIMPSACTLLIMPFITQKIGPADYGIAGLYLSIVTGILVSIEFSVIVRKAYVRHDQGERLSQTLSSFVSIYALIIAAFCCAAMLGWGWLSGFLPLSWVWVIAALGMAGLQAFVALAFSLLQIAVRVKPYCMLKIVFTVSHVGGILVGLYLLGMGWEALPIATSFATVLTAALSAIKVRQIFSVRWAWRREVFVSNFRDILSLAPFRVALAIFTYAGPFLVVYAVDTQQSGLYLFAYQIGNVISLVYDSVLFAIVPHMVALGGSPMAVGADARRKLAVTYVAVVCVTSAALVAVAPTMVAVLFPPAYAEAIPFILWVAVARCFHGMNRMHQELSFFHADSFQRIALVSLVVALCYVPVTLWLIGQHGPVGAAMGLAAGHGVWLGTLLVGRHWLVRRA